MKYSRGELPPREFLAVHRDASELLDILNENLLTGEYLVTVADWPAVRKRTPSRQFVVLKTLMLITPLVLVISLMLAYKSPAAALIVGLSWLLLFSLIALGQLWRRMRDQKSREGRSVVIVTDRRLMRVWLDGSGEIQSFPLAGEKSRRANVEPVPETVRVLLRADLGKTFLN